MANTEKTENTAPKLIVGLGNPGKEYQQTRHNVGFDFLDALPNLDFQTQTKFFGDLAKSENVFYLKPLTFMNNSGKAVAAIANFYKILPQEIIIIHDELDIAPGKVKIKIGGRSGGHNGLKSIAEHLGSENFWRIRLGIGHPRNLSLSQSVVDFVLSKANPEHQIEIQNCMDRIIKNWELFLQGNFAEVQRILH